MKLNTTMLVPDDAGATCVRVELRANHGLIKVDYPDPVEALNDACAFVETALAAVRRAGVAAA